MLQIVIRESAGTTPSIGALSVLEAMVEVDGIRVRESRGQQAERGRPNAHRRALELATLCQLLGDGGHGIALLLDRPSAASDIAQCPTDAGSSARSIALVAVTVIVRAADGELACQWSAATVEI